jgi:hypothetical protein
MSLSIAAAGAKSPATIVSRFDGLPQREWETRNAVRPHGLAR